MIRPGLEQPLLVVAEQAGHTGRAFRPQPEDRVDARARLRPAIDVVADEDDFVSPADLGSDHIQQALQSGEVAVNVADDDGCHQAR